MQWNIDTPADDPRFAVAGSGPDLRNNRYEDPGEVGAVRSTTSPEAPSSGPVFAYSPRTIGRSYYDQMGAMQGMSQMGYLRQEQALMGLGGTPWLARGQAFGW